jgi:uncharacterized protein with HEPN domain
MIYKKKLEKIIEEINIHLNRIDEAFDELNKKYSFPLNDKDFENLIKNRVDLAFADQIIYRFSKAQDTTGAKFFKTFLLYQGENVDKPFLDILDRFEKMEIVNIDEWFLLREIRNEITHEYEDNEELAKNILNAIYKHKNQLKKIINTVKIG